MLLLILSVTNNVLDWSKLERHAEAACRPVSLDMRTVCESILMLLPNRDDADEVDLMVVVSPDVPHSLFLDETYIHRILMNLLSNALKFTRSGYILMLIEMRNSQLVATVEDTGSGIPSPFLPHLFEPFTQAESRGSHRGTGLGLSIIKQLLHKMQGDIRVESRHSDMLGVEDGETGSTFTITLPVQLSENAHYITSMVSPVATGTNTPKFRPRVAIFLANNDRLPGGLRTAWDTFGYEAVVVQTFSDLTRSEWKYVWADLALLAGNQDLLQQLLDQKQWVVLVAYDTQDALKQYPRILSAPKFITLQKPLIWHAFEQRIAESSGSSHNILTKAVSFAPTEEVLDHDSKEQKKDDFAEKKLVILLVEDNPVT